MKNNGVKFSLPLLPEPRPIRVKFRKVGDLQYISHLDLQRTFSRVLVRAGLPLWYTQGFNPHIKMVFGLPLPVGCESECEFLDLRLAREMTDGEVAARLNDEVTPEMRILAVYTPTRKFTDIAFAEYEYELVAAGEDLAGRVRETLAANPLPLVKKGKSGERTVNLAALMRDCAVTPAPGGCHIRATLAAGQGEYLSPEALIGVLREKLGIFCGDPTAEHYRILRRRVLTADGGDFT